DSKAQYLTQNDLDAVYFQGQFDGDFLQNREVRLFCSGLGRAVTGAEEFFQAAAIGIQLFQFSCEIAQLVVLTHNSSPTPFTTFSASWSPCSQTCPVRHTFLPAAAGEISCKSILRMSPAFS